MDPEDKTPHMDVDAFKDLTADIPKPGREFEEEIGGRIKKIREEKGLSLDTLAKLTGFDAEFLSKIEKKEVQPQLGTVMRLSKVLDSTLNLLVFGAGEKDYVVTRKNERKSIKRSMTREGNRQLYTYKSLAPEVKGRHMEALIVQLEKNPDEITSKHEGEEFIYILEGTAIMKIGDDRFDLEPGDSVYYMSTTPHMIASKKGRATILAVLYEG